MTAALTRNGTCTAAVRFRNRIRLPHAREYAPDVHIRIVQRDAGLFWTDGNIVPESTRVVEERFAAAAERSNNLQTAESNAIQVVAHMRQLGGNDRVEFIF